MADEKSTNQLTPDQEVAYSKTLVEISEKQLIKGRVVGMNDSEDVLIDIGFKSEGIIDRIEFNEKEFACDWRSSRSILEALENASGNYKFYQKEKRMGINVEAYEKEKNYLFKSFDV